MKWNKWFLFVLVFITLERVCYFATGGFSPYKIQTTASIAYPWEVSETSDVEEILNQPFFYLGKGVQFYAFISEDKKTVLKFIKQQHSRPSDWIAALSGNETQQIQRRTGIFQSCQIAYEVLREETGLIFVQLAPKKGKKRPLQVFDKLNIAHTIDLNAASFVLQKKAEPFLAQLKSWKKQGELETSKAALDSLLHLIAKRTQKGIVNTDAHLRNLGLIGNKVLAIDIGSFKNNQESNEKFKDETLELKEWLDTHYPELAPYYDAKKI